MSTIIKAIQKINPTAEVSVSGENINTIQWHNGTTPISKADIEAQFTAVELDMAMENLRAKRDKLIAETDYLALSDNTLSEAMTTYRQALRDITNGITTVEQANNVTWPTKPSE
jgi:propanediol dehydratase large subunit